MNSTQERWDVVLRFHDGPLYYQGEVICRGPVVRLGARPGPGGLVLDGYRGLDERQAVITAYDGGTVAIAPVGHNQVRVAPHGNVDWESLQTLKGPVYLSPGDVFHLGSPGRGATATFVESRRLGTWQQQRILSEAASAETIQPVNIKEIDAKRGIPAWFIPSFLVMGMGTMAAIALMLVPLFVKTRSAIGPTIEGEAYFIDKPPPVQTEGLEESLLEGLEQGFDVFVMAENAKAAGQPKLRDNPKDMDPVFYKHVVGSIKVHANAWNFWRELEKIKDDYAYVVSELSAAGMPTIFAAIPYWESRYKKDARSYVCALGHWQFMPETAKRVGLEVRNCKLRGRDVLWSPTQLAPAPVSRSEYVAGGSSCLIQSCEVDERGDLAKNTRGAIQLLKESWDNEVTQGSGAAVQITILAHNAGFNDGQYVKGKTQSGLLYFYNQHLKATKKTWAPDFYGQNIRCTSDSHAVETTADKCGSLMWNQTQHYGYNIVAEHILAVCYYATNHGDEPAFQAWKQFTLGRGYCSSINVPDKDKLYSQGKK